MKFTTQKYIPCRCFQSWVPHPEWKTDILSQKGQGFWRELRAWLQPSSAPASCTTMHGPPGTRSQAWKGTPGGFHTHYNTCAPLCHRQVGRTPASEVLTYSETVLILGWIHKADPPVFLEVLFIQNAYQLQWLHPDPQEKQSALKLLTARHRGDTKC